MRIHLVVAVLVDLPFRMASLYQGDDSIRHAHLLPVHDLDDQFTLRVRDGAMGELHLGLRLAALLLLQLQLVVVGLALISHRLELQDQVIAAGVETQHLVQTLELLPRHDHPVHSRVQVNAVLAALGWTLLDLLSPSLHLDGLLLVGLVVTLLDDLHTRVIHEDLLVLQ